jgi:serine/threonine-protein kinase
VALPQVGEVIDGRYRVDEVLGGNGAVLGVTHIRRATPTRMAIKFLRDVNPATVMRFTQAARLSSMIGSQHVIDVADFGQLPDGVPYTVMEYIAGPSVARLLAERGRLTVADAVALALGVCAGLAAVHAQHVVHRDVRPGHLLVPPTAGGAPFVKLIDFGSATKLDGSERRLATASSASIIGTPAYASPEQLSAQPVDGRADLWSLGVVLFQLLAGRLPFEATTIPDMCVRVVTEPAPPLTQLRPEIPPELAAAVARCLEKEPAARFATADELAATLRRLPT